MAQKPQKPQPPQPPPPAPPPATRWDRLMAALASEGVAPEAVDFGAYFTNEGLEEGRDFINKMNPLLWWIAKRRIRSQITPSRVDEALQTVREGHENIQRQRPTAHPSDWPWYDRMDRGARSLMELYLDKARMERLKKKLGDVSALEPGPLGFPGGSGE